MAMKPWCTALLALSLLGNMFRPHLNSLPWIQMDAAFQVPHGMFWPVLALNLLLAGVPIELRLGRLALMAGWTLPLLVQRWLQLPPSPLLAGLSLVVILLIVSYRQSEPLPRRVWLTLGVLEAFTLWLLAPHFLALIATLVCAAAVAWNVRTEAVSVLGLASAMAWMLLWLS
jgi:hypothetical protein